MLQIDHQESHDVDIFLDDPQVLPFLNPETQGYVLKRKPDSYTIDGSRALKLAYETAGEIDFICCEHITNDAVASHDVRGKSVALETPAEIIAKKIYFRGGSFQPRDMFDLAAVVEHYGLDYVIAAARQCGGDRCATALDTIAKAKPAFVQSIIGQLMFREKNGHLGAEAQFISGQILERALCQLS